MSASAGRSVAQAWVSLRSEDPETESAFAVARERLGAAASLRGLRRFRVFELRGALPDAAGVAELLHRSTQFYNPAKERCIVRREASGPPPVGPDEAVALVAERKGDRRSAAERWWRHATGGRIEVREGVAWVMRFEPGTDAAALAAELAVTRDREHGLFCNPHAQAAEVVLGPPPLDRWPGARRAREAGGREGGDA